MGIVDTNHAKPTIAADSQCSTNGHQKRDSSRFFWTMRIAQAHCAPAASLLKGPQIKGDNTVISAVATTLSSDEE